MTNTQISFTCFTGSKDSRLTKTFRKNVDGSIEKISQPLFLNGNAKLRTISTLAELPNAISTLTANQAISIGIFDEPEVEIFSKRNLSAAGSNKFVRTRSKSNMTAPELGLALFDYDADSYMPNNYQITDVNSLIAKLRLVIPELSNIEAIGRPSSSSGIVDDQNSQPTTSSGLHLYIASAVDPKKLGEFIKVRLWNSGYGYISFARNGAMLERCLLDISVLSSERLIYEAAPVLEGGLTRQEQSWTHVAGDALIQIPELSPTELNEYRTRVKKAKSLHSNLDKSGKLEEGYLNEKTTELVETTKIGIDLASKKVRHQIQYENDGTACLAIDMMIDIDGMKISVEELVKNGKNYDRTAMPDPIEGPSYGTTTAIFYNNNGRRPIIRSFAHGIPTVYHLDGFAYLGETEVVYIPAKRTIKKSIVAKDATPHKPINPLLFPEIGSRGNTPTTINNVKFMLEHYGFKLSYDPIKKREEIIYPGMNKSSAARANRDNAAYGAIESLCNLNGLKSNAAMNYISSIAENSITSVAQRWIDSRPWDGVQRIQQLSDSIIADSQFPIELKNLFVRKWIISGAAAIYKVGFRARGVLTFQGPQSIGKTAFFTQLIQPERISREYILTDHHLDPSNKDLVLAAISHWIVEIGELDSSFKKDIARLKGFLSSREDNVRNPYARKSSAYPRMTIFCATVNQQDFMVDDTGNSRFWTIPVTGFKDTSMIDMQQMWAEAKCLLNKGEQWWLTAKSELMLEQTNAAHAKITVVHQCLVEYLDFDAPEDKWQKIQASKLLKDAGIENPTNNQAKECATALRAFGYPEPRKIKGYAMWHVPPAKTPQSWNM
jgi:hypothetical protein